MERELEREREQNGEGWIKGVRMCVCHRITIEKMGMPEMSAAGGKTKDATSASLRTPGPVSPESRSSESGIPMWVSGERVW